MKKHFLFLAKIEQENLKFLANDDKMTPLSFFIETCIFVSSLPDTASLSPTPPPLPPPHGMYFLHYNPPPLPPPHILTIPPYSLGAQAFF